MRETFLAVCQVAHLAQEVNVGDREGEKTATKTKTASKGIAFPSLLLLDGWE